jgi:hypothetical protein
MNLYITLALGMLTTLCLMPSLGFSLNQSVFSHSKITVLIKFFILRPSPGRAGLGLVLRRSSGGLRRRSALSPDSSFISLSQAGLTGLGRMDVGATHHELTSSN